jgi:hypothetical protein
MLKTATVNNLLKISLEEVIEPETIRSLFPSLTEEEFNKLQATIVCYNSNYVFENFYVFENVIRALNGIIPTIDLVEGCSPEWIWYGCKVLEKLRPDMELSDEVVEYIKKIFADSGIYFLPPYAIKDKNSGWKQIYEAAKHKTSTGPFPIEAEDFLDRQALELMKLELYCENMEAVNARQ